MPQFRYNVRGARTFCLPSLGSQLQQLVDDVLGPGCQIQPVHRNQAPQINHSGAPQAMDSADRASPLCAAVRRLYAQDMLQWEQRCET